MKADAFFPLPPPRAQERGVGMEGGKGRERKREREKFKGLKSRATKVSAKRIVWRECKYARVLRRLYNFEGPCRKRDYQNI